MKLIEQNWQEFEKVKEVLIEKAKNDEIFKEKLENNTASFNSLKEFLYDQASKLPKKNDCVAVEDTVVIGWAIHFIDEEMGAQLEESNEEQYQEIKEQKNKPTVKSEPKKQEQNENQMSIFDFL